MKLNLKFGKLSFQFGSRPATAQRPTVAGSRAVPAERSNAPTLQRSTGNPIQAWLRGAENNGTDANAVLVSPYQQSVWVYTVVSALAQTVSAIPFRISRGGRSGDTLLTEGAVVDLFNHPHQILRHFRQRLYPVFHVVARRYATYIALPSGRFWRQRGRKSTGWSRLWRVPYRILSPISQPLS